MKSLVDLKPGDIVRRRRQGGRKSIVSNLANAHGHEVGLVIKEYKEETGMRQFAVKFPSTPSKLLWFRSYELIKVTSELCQSV